MNPIPGSGLLQATDGNFYGTTNGDSLKPGTVFRLTPGGTLRTLVNYSCSGLIQATDGNFYGTTSGGGTNDNGTVFKLTPGGTLTTLVNFNYPNGSSPQGGLIQASDGNLYGTTSGGGRGLYYGTVFKVTTAGTLRTLLNFDGSNGANPKAKLIQASDGNLYGTTAGDSSNTDYGTVFKLTLGGTLTTLVNFNNTNGGNPLAGLLQASDGNLYGTTSQGGSDYAGLSGGGELFRLQMGPAVASLAQTGVTATSATLNGTVNPGGYKTNVSFQYGTSPSLATFSTASAGTLPVGTADTAVQTTLFGLKQATTYYFRVVAINAENPVPQYGSIRSFTTTPPGPEIDVQQPVGTSLVDGTAKKNFGTAVVGQIGTAKIFTIINNGTSNLIGLSVSKDGTNAGDFLITPPAKTALAPGGKTTFKITFKPTASGIRNATIHIKSNDADENPFDIQLTGLGA